MSKSVINIVWFKRDLRLRAHEPLDNAIKSGLTLLCYVFDPDLINDPHYDKRNWYFVWQSIEGLHTPWQLSAMEQQLY